MKSYPSFFRSAAFLISVATLAPFTSAAPAAEGSQDPATRNLLRDGSITVLQAGPFVSPGTFRVQVSTKFGRPDVVLADGTWMYNHRRVEGSEAEGTLVVRFQRDRVSSLTLVTPAVATAMRTNPPRSHNAEFVATK